MLSNFEAESMEGRSKNTIGINYNAVCDLDRIDRFKQLFLGMT